MLAKALPQGRAPVVGLPVHPWGSKIVPPRSKMLNSQLNAIVVQRPVGICHNTAARGAVARRGLGPRRACRRRRCPPGRTCLPAPGASAQRALRPTSNPRISRTPGPRPQGQAPGPGNRPRPQAQAPGPGSRPRPLNNANFRWEVIRGRTKESQIENRASDMVLHSENLLVHARAMCMHAR